ncbi:gluconokinase [Vibrio sp. D404a]|uniref:gluconokinase n=1 Tax=unclassified Vibrio TaxID=2614977 RepID=UPI0025532B0B|nr:MULTISPECIES: gluconokinase [unclassified Vibrio]MDK9737317.1 gluconokinase [Vibrio sp. D404a]MDK9798007.1 gluconokinase [Vibrio sp. D449a]
MKAKKILVMGVSGCGKSLIGSEIANALNLPFHDGDDYHPQANVDKMAEGIPLNDDDRQGWLETLNKVYRDNDAAVIACSALKPAYRDILRNNNQELVIVYLQGSFETIWNRHKSRENHYFNGEAMLKSQFEALVEPHKNEALFIDIAQDVQSVIDDAIAEIKKHEGAH